MLIKNVLEYLEASANKYPDKIAVRDNIKSYTYKNLLENSKAIGTALAGKVNNEPVAVFCDKGADALCAFFGIIYADGFYSLINPTLPQSRIEGIIRTLSPKIVLTEGKNYFLAKRIFTNSQIFVIDELMKTTVNEEILLDIRNNSIDTNPLYANFTSGSSGVPKGVLIAHRSVINFIDEFVQTFGICENDIIANQAPFDFDVSVKDIYSAIKVGATLVIVSKDMFSNPSGLMDYLCDNNITTMIWAVSALCLLSGFHALEYKIPKKVSKVLFSGEVMPYKHLQIWLDAMPDTTFVNLYGPTEITCNCTYHIIDNNRSYENGIPIGKPFDNQGVFLLDEGNNLITENDTVGEICVKGSNLALGYYNQSEQTRKYFVQNPLNPYYPEIIYRTGDLARYDEFGDLKFCGRKDFQIKYQGHRIELEEIEKAVNSIDNVERCCCVFYEEKSRLTCYYIGIVERKELRETMRQVLPVFMIPNSIKKIDAFPVTANGKIDRKALKGGGY